MILRDPNLHINPTLIRAARFALVGLLGTVVDFSLFFAAQSLLSIPALFANTFSYSAGILNNYFFHRNWTFSQPAQKAVGRQLAVFVIISLSALMLNNLIVFLLTPSINAYFTDVALSMLLAKICAIAVGMGWNFVANTLWTFRA